MSIELEGCGAEVVHFQVQHNSARGITMPAFRASSLSWCETRPSWRPSWQPSSRGPWSSSQSVRPLGRLACAGGAPRHSPRRRPRLQVEDLRLKRHSGQQILDVQDELIDFDLGHVEQTSVPRRPSPCGPVRIRSKARIRGLFRLFGMLRLLSHDDAPVRGSSPNVRAARVSRSPTTDSGKNVHAVRIRRERLRGCGRPFPGHEKVPVQSPSRALELGLRWRWRWDLNPRLRVTQHSLSRRAPSAARTRHRREHYRIPVARMRLGSAIRLTAGPRKFMGCL